MEGFHNLWKTALLVAALVISLSTFAFTVVSRSNLSQNNCRSGNESRAVIVKILTDLVTTTPPSPVQQQLVGVIEAYSAPKGPLAPRDCG